MATIKELRERSEKTRALVAADLDLSERHLYRLETGRTPLRHVLALAFANYYGVSVKTIDDVEPVVTEQVA